MKKIEDQLLEANIKLKKQKIKELFKKIRLVSTTPEEIDNILKTHDIDIKTSYKPVGNLTLFQYCIYHTNNIKMMNYLYNNGGYKDGDFRYSIMMESKNKQIKTYEWFLEKNMIKDTENIDIIEYIFKNGFYWIYYTKPTNQCYSGRHNNENWDRKNTFNKLLFDWMKCHFDITKYKNNDNVYNDFVKNSFKNPPV